jgi:hypothetical protein
MSAGRPSRPKFMMIGRGVSPRHVGEIYDSRSFFSSDLLGKRTVDPERWGPTCYTPIDAALAKDVPFGGLIDTSHLLGSYPRKTPHFGAANGDSQLKRLRAYLGTG